MLSLTRRSALPACSLPASLAGVFIPHSNSRRAFRLQSVHGLCRWIRPRPLRLGLEVSVGNSILPNDPATGEVIPLSAPTKVSRDIAIGPNGK